VGVVVAFLSSVVSLVFLFLRAAVFIGEVGS
jgi:hypothetical protein